MALGCSTNSMLHLPAIAHEIGFDFDIALIIASFLFSESISNVNSVSVMLCLSDI